MYATFTNNEAGCQDLAVPDRLLIRPGAVVTPAGLRSDLDVAVEAGEIVAIGPALAHSPGAELLELPAAVLAPGFVDLHVHEVGGAGVLDAARADVGGLAARLAAHGTTSFLATTATVPTSDLEVLLKQVASAEPQAGSARCLGVHLEGPWLSPHRAGAQPPEHLATPSADALQHLLECGPVRMVTLAPELPGAAEVIDLARRMDVVVALGHSDASYDQAAAAVAAGARHITHCFNAMPPLHHRDPGLVGAALDLPDVTVEVIADGVHLHPAVVRLVHRAVGAGRVCVVSDAVDRDPRGDGVLAGAAVSQDVAVRNLVSWGIRLVDAVTMASTAPANVLGRTDIGRIEVGALADCVLLDPTGALLATVVGGVRR